MTKTLLALAPPRSRVDRADQRRPDANTITRVPARSGATAIASLWLPVDHAQWNTGYRFGPRYGYTSYGTLPRTYVQRYDLSPITATSTATITSTRSTHDLCGHAGDRAHCSSG